MEGRRQGQGLRSGGTRVIDKDKIVNQFTIANLAVGEMAKQLMAAGYDPLVIYSVLLRHTQAWALALKDKKYVTDSEFNELTAELMRVAELTFLAEKASKP